MFGQLSPSRMPSGEPILLNVRDLPSLTEKQKQVLNFGNQPSTLNWPIGEIDEFYEKEESASIRTKLKNFFS
jgi:hypothetical protein